MRRGSGHPLLTPAPALHSEFLMQVSAELCNALRGDRPRLVAESRGPDGRLRLLFEDGSAQDIESNERSGRARG